MTLTGGYGGVDPAHARSVLDHALEHGVGLLDTADAYPGGEQLVASVRAVHPEHPVRIVTKIGLAGPPGRRSVCGRPDYLRHACKRSLQRLGGERLDILLLHRVDPQVPVEDSMSCLAQLVKEGKVAQIGLCTSDPGVLRRAATAAPLSFVQSALSVLAPAAAGGLLAATRQIGCTLIASSPLGRGLVAGDRAPSTLPADDARAHVPEMDTLHRARAEAFRRLAAQVGMSDVDLALGWIDSLGPDVVPIPGARSRKHVTQNLRAQACELSPSALLAVGRFVSETRQIGHAQPGSPRGNDARYRLGEP
ncbi:aldo/keto reductase [Arsenicicoccus bolidensis]|uniref:aldo/keto reductase n=1 Tax=Arsenicicoccus bolidensis TaxID=229480 RepID=UPI0028AFE9A8|nr:aldo/keto reductase [Arsenicicoccus bolidensis]